MKLSAKLFIEKGSDYVLGPGRVALLRATAELGSLHQAAKRLGMSYRWAWGRLRDTEKALGVKLLTQDGPFRRGAPKILTPEAQALLAWYDRLEGRITEALILGADERPEFLSLETAPPDAPANGRTALD